MLKFWRSHADYQSFVSDTVSSFSETELLKLQSYSKSRHKLDSLNLDAIGLLLAPSYSNTGRPAQNQPEILRSFVLMMDLGITSIDCWQKYLHNDFILATLVGCTLDSLPPLGSYYDFIDRLWLRNPEFEKNGRKDLFPSSKNKKPSQKPGKGKKLPNRHSGITEKIASHIRLGKNFPFYYEELLQQLFSLAVIVPSCNPGSLTPVTLPFPATAPVSMPMRILMDILFICYLTTISRLARMSRCISAFLMPEDTTACLPWSVCQCFAGCALAYPSETLSGIYACIRQSHMVRQNIKKYITTVQVHIKMFFRG